MQYPRAHSEVLAAFTTANNPQLSEAAQAVPDVAQALAQVEDYRNAMNDWANPTGESFHNERDTIVNRAVSAITQGEEIPADTFDHVAQAYVRGQAHMVALEVAAMIDARLVGNLATAVTANVDGLYAALGQLMHTCMSSARAAHQAAGHLTNGDAAINQGLTDEWKALGQARTHFVAIRRAQSTVYRHGEDLDRPMRLDMIAMTFADPLTVWPDLPHFLRWTYRKDEMGNRRTLEPPWPSLHSQHEEMFDWLMDHPDAEVWVPTRPERDQLRAAITEAAQSLNDPSERARQWRRRHSRFDDNALKGA